MKKFDNKYIVIKIIPITASMNHFIFKDIIGKMAWLFLSFGKMLYWIHCTT